MANPKVSRRGTRVGTAPPVDPLGGVEVEAAREVPVREVTLLEAEPEIEGTAVLTVWFCETVTDPILDTVGEAKPEVRVDIEAVRDGVTEELDDDGALSSCATIRTWAH